MKVSIITVCFNSAATIARTIESVAAQTYDNIEYVIVDGASSDGTQQIVQSSSKHVSTFLSEPDEGIYDAMNKGIANTTGEFITFLNADDVFAHKLVVAKSISALIENDVDLVFGDVEFFDGERLVRHYSSKSFKPWKMRFGWMPPHPGCFAKKELFKSFGGFEVSLRIAADYEMYVRWLMIQKLDYVWLNDVHVHMALGGVSTESWRARLKLNREIVAACRMNDVYTNLFFVLSKVPFKLMELLVKTGQKESA